MKILLDTNVLLDYLLGRVPFFKEANQIIQLGAYDDYFELVSSSAVTDIFYLANKALKDSKATQNKMSELLQIVSVLDVTSRDIDYAFKLQWKDFEDAVQYAAAMANGIDVIISRNVADFEEQKIPVMKPEEFLSALEEGVLSALSGN